MGGAKNHLDLSNFNTSWKLTGGTIWNTHSSAVNCCVGDMVLKTTN